MSGSHCHHTTIVSSLCYLSAEKHHLLLYKRKRKRVCL